MFFRGENPPFKETPCHQIREAEEVLNDDEGSILNPQVFPRLVKTWAGIPGFKWRYFTPRNGLINGQLVGTHLVERISPKKKDDSLERKF